MSKYRHIGPVLHSGIWQADAQDACLPDNAQSCVECYIQVYKRVHRHVHRNMSTRVRVCLPHNALVRVEP